MTDDILEYWMSLARELAHKYNIEQFDTSSEMWSWDNFKEDIQSLKNRLGVGEDYVDILGLHLNLETGETLDTISNTKTSSSRIMPHLFYYSKAKDEGTTEDWVKFNTLRGSWACRYSFDEENLNALLSAYEDKKEKLFDAFERLGAVRADYGDAAFIVSFLPMVRVLVVFEDADEEFPASVRMLFDRNSIFYLPHEMLGDISWFLASRALKASA